MFATHAALQGTLAERGFDLLAAIGAVGPNIGGRVARVENVVELLAVVHARVADRVAAYELVLAIDVHVVLVAEVRTPVLFRPARVPVLLSLLCRLPILRRLARLDRLVVVPAVALPGGDIAAAHCGQAQRRLARLDRRPAGEEASAAGYGGAGQQARPNSLGDDEDRRRLSHRDVRESVTRATVAA